MLTKKQQWRRTVSHRELSKERKMATQRQFEEFLKATRFEGGGDGLNPLYSRAISEPTIRVREQMSLEPPKMRRRSTTGEISSKHVHWGAKSRVILIPSRQDYLNRGLDHELWWEKKDYENFKDSAKDEVQDVMVTKHLNIFAAMSDLYQPDHDDETEGSVRSVSSSLLSLDDFDSELKDQSNPSVTMTIAGAVAGAAPLSSSKPNYVRKSSGGSVDSQGSTNSAERRPINFLEIHPKKVHQIEENVEKPIHPLALIAGP